MRVYSNFCHFIIREQQSESTSTCLPYLFPELLKLENPFWHILLVDLNLRASINDEMRNEIPLLPHHQPACVHVHHFQSADV